MYCNLKNPLKAFIYCWARRHTLLLTNSQVHYINRGLATNNEERLEIFVSINNQYILHIRLRTNIADEKHAAKITREINTKYK